MLFFERIMLLLRVARNPIFKSCSLEGYNRGSYWLEESNTGTVKLVILPRKIGT